MLIEPTLRPLRKSELRLLRSQVRELERDASRRPPFILLGVPFVALWALTLLASDAPWPVVTAFWFVVGTGITLWVARDLRKGPRFRAAQLDSLRSASERAEAEVIDVRAHSFVEMEEVEDEGACYVFELDSGRLLVLHGQQYYSAPKFPSLDFSLVYPLDAVGHPVDEIIEKRGPWARPIRLVPAATAKHLRIPESLTLLTGRLEDIEEVLGRVGGRAG